MKFKTIIVSLLLMSLVHNVGAVKSTFVYRDSSGIETPVKKDDIFVSRLKKILDSNIGISENDSISVNVRLGKCYKETKACYSATSYGGKRNIAITVDKTMDTESVVIKAFVHELGHARFALLPEKQQEEFFSISHSKENKWANTKGRTMSDFASGYGASFSDKTGVGRYEDFAEAYTMYVFHNAQFKKIAETNIDMKKKYMFMKIRVFRGQYLSGTDFTYGKYSDYTWDMTKRPVDMKSFAKYLTYWEI